MIYPYRKIRAQALLNLLDLCIVCNILDTRNQVEGTTEWIC
jgi:hypothetical protein